MLIFTGLLTCLMVTVIIADFTRFIIPNWLVGIVLALYPFMVYFSPARPDWKISILIMLGVFVVGFILFAMGAMGGGDIKLFTALSLWTGQVCTFELAIWMALLGGIFAILLWLLRLAIDAVLSKRPEKPALMRVLTKGAPVPYGIAIAVAFIALLWMGKVPGVPGIL